jgi:uncharacterized protein (DUF2147 family)
MKKVFLILTLSIVFQGFSQTVIGKWKTIDDETGKEKSVVEIFAVKGKIYGKITEIIEVANRDKICTECTDEDKNKPILGMVIIKGLNKDGNEYNGGKILDPKNGKLYKCYITLESKDKLKVRGYVGFSLLGRTQYWYRVKTII